MINNTRFSKLNIGDVFAFRSVFIGRVWIKTGAYSFVPDPNPDATKNGYGYRREELLVSDLRVTKYTHPEMINRDKVETYWNDHEMIPF